MKIVLEPAFDYEPVEFRSYSELLRWLVKHLRKGYSGGGPQTLMSLYLGSRRKNGAIAPSSLYDVNQRLWTHKITAEDHEAALGLLARYRHTVHYFEEVWPQWRTVRTIPYMDNSVEEEQVDRFGNVRSVRTVEPHGDVCF